MFVCGPVSLEGRRSYWGGKASHAVPQLLPAAADRANCSPQPHSYPLQSSANYQPQQQRRQQQKQLRFCGNRLLPVRQQQVQPEESGSLPARSYRLLGQASYRHPGALVNPVQGRVQTRALRRIGP